MRSIFFALLLFCAHFLYGQDNKQQINQIKQNSDYLNAEATDETFDDAYNVALEELISEACNKFSVDIPIEKVKKTIKFIEIRRGESFRVFVYALADDLRNIAIDTKPLESSNLLSSESASADVNENVVPDTSQGSNKEEQKQFTLTLDQSKRLESVSEIFSRMNTLSEIKSLIREYKTQGKLHDYNWVNSNVIPQDAHIVVFRGESIIAVLLNEKNSKRLNVITSQEDEISNYSKCRAIWYK